MPAIQRGSVYPLKRGGYGIQYRDENGERQRESPFPTKTAAREWFRNHVEPRLRGERPAVESTLAEFVVIYLDRHTSARGRTIDTLRERLAHATATFGDVPLQELENMTDEIAAWQAALPERSRYGIVQALRQTLEAATRWKRMASNPAKLAGKNPQPPPRPIRVYTPEELVAIGLELSTRYRPLPEFAAATGLRPEEWAPLERRDIDRRAGVVNVVRTVSGGKTKDAPREVVELAKTNASRRQVPLTDAALAALDAMPPRLDTPLLFPAPAGGLLNLDNFRRREWGPAVDAATIPTPARIYDLRSTFASDALAAGVTVFELAKVMGTSVRMIERHYGALLDGAQAGIAARLNAHRAERLRTTSRATEDGKPPHGPLHP